MSAQAPTTDDLPQPDLARLYRELSPGMRALCKRILKSDTAARDATQETFARVLARKPIFYSWADAARYLHRVAMNVCISHLRRSRSGIVFNDEVATAAWAVGRGEDGEVDRHFAMRVLSECDAATRDAAIMCLIEEHGCGETARLLGCSRRSVYTWLQKLKLKAKDLLDESPAA